MSVRFDAVLKMLTGEKAWGLSRSTGSMFFLEIGKPVITEIPNIERLRVYKEVGEWHFLFEMCHWKFNTPKGNVVGSDDDPEFIDRHFLDLKLGKIKAIAAPDPSHDLDIDFSSGVRLRTFSTTAVGGWTQWNLYCPGDFVWVASAMGKLDRKDTHA